MKKRITVTILLNTFFILLVLVIILPATWLIINSLRTSVELFTDSLAPPAKVQFASYISAWDKRLYKYFGSSVIISSTPLISILLLSPLLAYGITRFNSRFENLIFLITLGGMALSEQVVLISLHKIFQATHLCNTYWVVILPYVASRISFTVFLMRAYSMRIPKELEGAAVIDDYNSFQIFRKTIVPISKPIFTSYAIVDPNFVWNESLFANMLLESKSIITVPIGLTTFRGDMRSDYVVVLVGITIAPLLTVILYLCMQKQFARGSTSDVAKG